MKMETGNWKMEVRNSKLENRNSSIVGGDAGNVARHFFGGFEPRNETGMSFRIRGDTDFPFFVLYFSGTKLECPLESIKPRGTNPNTKPTSKNIGDRRQESGVRS
jgi:hypothetical protein